MKIQDKQTRSAQELALERALQPKQTEQARPQGQAASVATKAAQGTSTPAAKVELSSKGREIQTALSAAKSAPDVRADKVAEVRKRLENGTYVIDPTRIARGILDSRA
jgi:flagellar biosynthesis anti-sigma factor FlgM